jgi:ribosome-binding factor A
MRTACAEVGPDDGIDPREVARARMNQHRSLKPRTNAGPGERDPGRKARQLGRQVAETLDLVFAGDSRDAVLSGLRVVSVTPAPDASRLVVTVASLLPADRVDPAEILARLGRASGWLRTEVAAAVTRRRAPALSFQIQLDPAEPGRAEPDH